MTVPVIDSDTYQEEYQTDDMAGYEQMFREHGEVVLVDWGDQMNVKTPHWGNGGELVGFHSSIIDRDLRPGMTKDEPESASD